MIDREDLRREAYSKDGDRTVVSRAWLKQVLCELAQLDGLRVDGRRRSRRVP